MIEAGKVYTVPDDGSLIDWNAGLPDLPPKLMTVTQRHEELKRIGMVETSWPNPTREQMLEWMLRGAIEDLIEADRGTIEHFLVRAVMVRSHGAANPATARALATELIGPEPLDPNILKPPIKDSGS